MDRKTIIKSVALASVVAILASGAGAVYADEGCTQVGGCAQVAETSAEQAKRAAREAKKAKRAAREAEQANVVRVEGLHELVGDEKAKREGSSMNEQAKRAAREAKKAAMPGGLSVGVSGDGLGEALLEAKKAKRAAREAEKDKSTGSIVSEQAKRAAREAKKAAAIYNNESGFYNS